MSFHYNDNVGIPGEQVGFIAEQVQQVDPRLVVLDASGTPFTVRYEQMTSLLAKAVQQIATITGTFKPTSSPGSHQPKTASRISSPKTSTPKTWTLTASSVTSSVHETIAAHQSV